MTHTYTVHLRRTWDERYAITVEAASPEEALQKANLEEDNVDFNWNNVEAAEREVMFIDDALSESPVKVTLLILVDGLTRTPLELKASVPVELAEPTGS